MVSTCPKASLEKIFFAQCNDQHTVHKLLGYQAKNIATDTGDFSLSNKNLAKLSQHFPYLLVMNQLSNYILFGSLKAFSLFVVFFNIPTFLNNYFELQERPSFADAHLMYLLKRNNLKNII